MNRKSIDQYLYEKKMCNIIHTIPFKSSIILFKKLYKKNISLFSKDQNVMIKTFKMLQNIYISDKCCSSELSIHQRNLKTKIYNK